MREACMCKGFGSTLTGPALQWFINLDNGIISSFAQLVNTFNMQFASSRKMEKQASDLHRIVQKSDESLKEFVNRFNREKVSIPNCDARMTIEAFRRGLDEESDLYKELTKYPCPTFEDAQAKALAQIRLEEDMQSRKAYANADNRKATSNKQASWRQKPYERPQQVHSVRQVGSASDWKDDPGLPQASEYGFNVTWELNGMHEMAQIKTPSQRAPSPRDAELEAMPITFDDADLGDDRDIHHDGLVISLTVSNCLLKRVLVDNGSSANILMRGALEDMG
ncbi:uncharacterized protein LOC130589811 [Beta vulgaris subsp. vulgaris]|uniref:uncharacterized protein LOC130589811 n=1 Tax=Beta vulgaris subsp. vulgaris TaxID=3555 RepID=UPI0025480236|nr:uncharacterized protein LOC130589811 [Beta vulgaris subsp. vulgaris]